MGKDIQARREQWKAWWGRRTRVGKITLVLLTMIFVCTALLLKDWLSTLDVVVISIAGMMLAPLLLILFFRWFTYRVLWRVRNRLILTYLLMGLAPVVMFAMLAAIMSYLLAGQYATNLGLSQLNQGLTRVHDQAGSAAILGTPVVERVAPAAKVTIQRRVQPIRTVPSKRVDTSKSEPEDGAPLSLMELKGSTWFRWRGRRRRTTRDR